MANIEAGCSRPGREVNEGVSRRRRGRDGAVVYECAELSSRPELFRLASQFALYQIVERRLPSLLQERAELHVAPNTKVSVVLLPRAEN